MLMLLMIMLLEVLVRLTPWWEDAARRTPAFEVMPPYLTLMMFMLLLGAAWSILRRSSLVDHIGYIVSGALLVDHLILQAIHYEQLTGQSDIIGYAIALLAYIIAPVGLCLMPMIAIVVPRRRGRGAT